MKSEIENVCTYTYKGLLSTDNVAIRKTKQSAEGEAIANAPDVEAESIHSLLMSLYHKIS